MTDVLTCEYERISVSSMDAIDLIRELRSRGLSQQAIAERCGLTQGAISHIETGRRKNVFVTTRDRLAALLEDVRAGRVTLGNASARSAPGSAGLAGATSMQCVSSPSEVSS